MPEFSIDFHDFERPTVNWEYGEPGVNEMQVTTTEGRQSGQPPEVYDPTRDLAWRVDDDGQAITPDVAVAASADTAQSIDMAAAEYVGAHILDAKFHPGRPMLTIPKIGHTAIRALAELYGDDIAKRLLRNWDSQGTDINPVTMEHTALELPDDIQELLDKKQRADFRGDNTIFFTLPGRPDLLVRYARHTPDEIREGNVSMRQAWAYHLPVLPTAYIEDGQGLPYVITKRVDGEPLLSSLVRPTARLLQEVEQAWAGQADHLKTSDTRGRDFLFDVERLEQYMVGSLRPAPGDTADPQPRLWLVDIPPTTLYPAADIPTYEEQLYSIARNVRHIEYNTQQRLSNARQSIAGAYYKNLSRYQLAVADTRLQVVVSRIKQFLEA
jgi:hypothetical protein